MPFVFASQVENSGRRKIFSGEPAIFQGIYRRLLMGQLASNGPNVIRNSRTNVRSQEYCNDINENYYRTIHYLKNIERGYHFVSFLLFTLLKNLLDEDDVEFDFMINYVHEMFYFLRIINEKCMENHILPTAQPRN